MQAIQNKKAKFKFGIEETFEAGIVLEGWEVKPILARKVNLDNTYVVIKDGELFLLNMLINPEVQTNKNSMITPISVSRTRKLLMKKNQIMKLIGKVEQKGFTLVPTKVYRGNNGKIKVEVALAKGKNEYDKRETVKNRDTDRELERVMKHSTK
jgi:SsrA-binding protein